MSFLKLPVPYICKTENTNMKKQKDSVVFVRHDALSEEVQVEQKTSTSSKNKKESGLNRSTLPCEQQAEQWF